MVSPSPSPLHLMVICRSGPYSSAGISAGIDLLLTAASFEQKVTVCFLGDGLMNLLAAASESPAVKNPAKAIGAFELYGVEDIVVIDSDLIRNGVDIKDLGFSVKVLSEADAAEIMQQADQVMVY